MIPVLYPHGEKEFLSEGIGRLADCISCHVYEERNGIFECEFVYPIFGRHYSDIVEGTVIYCTHDETGVPQPFDVYAHSAPIDGKVTFFAQHVTYRLNRAVAMPFTASSVVEAISKISANSVVTIPFTFWTDKTTTGNFTLTEPRSIRAILGGQQGSLLDVYGTGEYEWDKFTVKLHASRGTDSGVEIRYGKNLVDITDEVDTGSSYNAVVPYWLPNSDDATIVTLPEKLIIYDGSNFVSAENATISGIVPLDLSSDFNSQPTVARLRDKAKTVLISSKAWEARQTTEVDFVALWQTEEYKDVAPLQRVRLCDTVSVFYPELGVEAIKQKVVKTDYNVLLDRYDKLELGESSYSYSQVIAEGLEDLFGDIPTTSFIESAISNATNLITGGLGGHVYLKPNADGQPEEILVMDDTDINQAVKLWRWNLGGLGYSSTGYNGTFGTAITMDGSIVADFITAGTMSANRIRAGLLTDEVGKNYWNLTNGEFSLSGYATTEYVDNEVSAEIAKTVGVLSVTKTFSGSNVVYHAHIIKNGEDVVNDYPERFFEWCKVDGTSMNETSLGIGRTWTINPEDFEYGGILVCYFRTLSDDYLAFSNGVLNFSQGRLLLSNVTTEQRAELSVFNNQIIDKISSAISDYDDALNSYKVFNKLTNNGQIQGIFMRDGKLYVNGTYIATGILADKTGKNAWNLDTGTLAMTSGSINLGAISGGGYNFSVNSNGNVNIKNGSINLGAVSGGGYRFSVDNNGALTATNATLNGSLITQSGKYMNDLKEGYMHAYYDGDYIGKVGTSLFVGDKIGMMMDIGYDCDYGGIAIQTSAGASGNIALGFYYDRNSDNFTLSRDLFSTRTFKVGTIESTDSSSDWLNLDAKKIVLKEDGTTFFTGDESSVNISSTSFTWDNYTVATQNWVSNQGYLTSVPSGYATQSWVQQQGYLTSANISFNKITDSGSNTDIELKGLRWYYDGQYGAGQVSTDIVFVAPLVINSSGQITSSRYVGIRVTNGIVRQVIRSARSSGAMDATTWSPNFTIN